MNELTIKNFETLELNELEAIDGGSAWSDLGKLVGAITTGALIFDIGYFNPYCLHTVAKQAQPQSFKSCCLTQ